MCSKRLHSGLTAFIVLCLSINPVFSQSNSTLQEYLSTRDSLLKVDSLLYFDRGETLNEDELRLESYLTSLQREMNGHYKAEHFFPPARNFYVSKAHIESTPLFKILQKMPKGGALHLHASAMGDVDWIIDRAIETEEMYVFWGDDDTDTYLTGQLHAFKEGQAPKGFHQVAKINREDPQFRGQLRSLITFENAMDQDSVDIWKEFQAVFQRIGRFVYYEPIFVDYITNGLQILVEDNVQHVELRLPFQGNLYNLENERNPDRVDDFVVSMNAILNNARKLDPDLTLKIIHAELRFKDQKTIREDIQQTFEYRKQYPEWLRGYDLVAEEDNGHPTLFHAANFLMLDSLEQASGVELPLYLHDGESNWASVDNLYDAVLLGTKRIGHGFNLFRFPSLLELVKHKDICVEVNPLSNQILGYIRDLRNHPASTYLRRGLNCVISSDDPLIFDYRGLTYDYWAIFLAWELDLSGLKKLSKNNLLYGALTEEERQKALVVWENRWQSFVKNTLEQLPE